MDKEEKEALCSANRRRVVSYVRKKRALPGLDLDSKENIIQDR